MCEGARVRLRETQPKRHLRVSSPFKAGYAPDNPRIILLRTFAGGTETYVLILALSPSGQAGIPTLSWWMSLQSLFLPVVLCPEFRRTRILLIQLLAFSASAFLVC